MVNVPRSKGTFAESAVVNYLRDNGFPWAERRSLKGAEDWGDVTGIPGLVLEVKYANGGIRMGEWISETYTERTNAGADHAILVIKPKGVGNTKVGSWYAVMLGWDFDALTSRITDVSWTCTGDKGFNQNLVAQELNLLDRFIGGSEVIALTRRPPGETDPGKWYRIMYFSDAIRLLRTAGYGTALPTLLEVQSGEQK